MADYGLTSKGVNIKRLDVILEEMHTELTKAWGVNTQQNPSSLLNAMLTNIADSIAELWELGQDVYNSQYPASAEGMYLDNVAQFTGTTREAAAPSYYHILCTGTDGTLIPESTIIASQTSPVTRLRPTGSNTISRANFNTAEIKVVSLDGNPLTVALNGTVYSVTPEDGDDAATALQALCDAITDDDFTAEINDDGYLYIASVSAVSTAAMILSDNLTTNSVGSVFTFATEDNGDIYLPNGAISDITKGVTGLTKVENVGTYVAGRDEETDTEYRQSYLDKIFTHSSRMVDSIRSAILNNCQGVTAIAVYENDTNDYDEYGRYPHSIEVVVDGGDETEIAQQILNTKAGGISTYGSVEVTLAGEYEEELTIRFNRPTYVYLWIHCEITVAQNSTLPTNYADLIRDVIVEAVEGLACGDDVIPQNLFLPGIYSSVYGIDYVEITMGTGASKPDEYTERNIYATVRERAVTDESMIEVVIDG